MKTRIAALAVTCALVLACDPLSRTEMTLTFDETGERVNIDVVSDEKHLKTYHDEERAQVGEDLLAGRDEWSQRFARVSPDDERLVINRANGRIRRVESQASIPASELQNFFYDVGVSVQVTRGEGWAELTMYPGESHRATRQQQQIVRRKLDEYSHRAVSYFDAVRAMYNYLAANETRGEELFYGVYAGERDEKPRLSEKEQALVAAVRTSAEALAGLGEEDNDELARLADLVYNAFPAAVEVRVPGEPLAVEGFSGKKGEPLKAATATPFEALTALEGRWASPDPLAAVVLRANDRPAREFAAEVAKEKRSVAPVVVASEIVDALVKGMQPAPRYRVRWVTKTRKGSTSS